MVRVFAAVARAAAAATVMTVWHHAASVGAGCGDTAPQ